MNTNLKKTAALLVALLAMLVATEAAQAYTTFGEWRDNRVIMRSSSVSFAPGAWRDALDTVEARIYNNPSEAWIEHAHGDSSVSFDNDQNEVWFTSDAAYSPAVTYRWTNWRGYIVEADVIFYTGEGYTTSMNKTSIWPFGGASRPFQTTCMHEYGHVLGLGHEDDEYNIMGQDWDHIHCNSSTARSYMGEDACDGLVALYGRASGGAFEDVSASMFEWSGRSGEYSTHNLCDVYTTGGAVVGSSSYNGQRRYNVNRGGTYDFEFTYENNGETTHDVRAGYYLSTNSYISTGDTLLRTATMTLGRNDVYTRRRSITIPNWVTRGSTYYIGVIVDDNNTLAEVDGSNNAAYHIIRIN